MFVFPLIHQTAGLSRSYALVARNK